MQAKKIQTFFKQAVLIALLCAVGAAPGMAAQLDLPAIIAPPSQEHHVGKVIFVELITPNLAAAERFYGALFGWTFHDIHAGGTEYAEATLDGQPVAGLVHKDLPTGDHRQPSWLSFLSVSDVDAARNTALEHGGKVLFEPHSIPHRGREAVLADPQGAIFAVLASSSGDPPDVLAAPGEWIWSSLVTSDPEIDAAFYQMLFDYEVFDLPTDEGAQNLMLASDRYARASINPPPANNGANLHPHWLNYVRVDDAIATSAKLETLGGRVLVAPRVDRHGGKIAVVSDPQGAPFGLLEWTGAESKEMPK
jgi:predicted enzyme related to lactoylglutathione lyase